MFDPSILRAHWVCVPKLHTVGQVNHVKEAVAMEDMVQFESRCEELAHESVDTIFTDQVVYGIVSRYRTHAC